MSAIATIRTRLAAIQSAISGVNRAYAYAPPSLPEADLPLFCNFIGPATSSSSGETVSEETRTYLMRLYGSPVQQGIRGDAEKLLDPFFVSVRPAFQAHPMLGLGTPDTALAWVKQARWLGDSGVTVLWLSKQQFLGIEFKLSVTVVAPVTIAPYE